MTKMRMFVLWSSAALLLLLLLLGPAHSGPARCSPAHSGPAHTLVYRNRILDLVEKYNNSLTEDVFVEDVSSLADGCEDKFFCKVHDILHNSTHFGGTLDERSIMANLRMLSEGAHRNCSGGAQGGTHPDVEVPIPKLLHQLTNCVKKRNFRSVT